MRRSFGHYLVALILLAVVPMLLISAVLTWRQTQLHRQALESSLQQTAQALSVAVDRQLISYRVMLETLARSQSLEEGDLERFHEYARRVAQNEGALFVSLFDAGGRQVFNTMRAPGEALPTPYARDTAAEPGDADRPPVGDPTPLELTFKHGKPYYSDLLYGLVAQRLIFLVNVPVVRQGRVAYVLNAAFEPSVMTKLLQENPNLRGLPAVIFDRKGFIIGRWIGADQYEGRRINNFGDVAGKASYVGTATTFEGIQVLYGYAGSPLSGWGVNVGPASAEFEAEVRTVWIIGAALSLTGLVVGVALATWLATGLRRSVRQLAMAAAGKAPLESAGLRTVEIVRVEQALQEAAAARESEAREREQRLVAEARRAETEQAIVAKDRFIALLSHELRNPLAPIRNAVEVLRRAKAHPGLAIEPVVDVIDRQSEHLTHLVNDLLDVSSIGQGKLTLDKRPLDLRRVAAHAVDTIVPALERRRHRLVQEVPAQPLQVDGDFVRLAQIVSNLLDNAVKFTPESGEIVLSMAREQDQVVLRVKDNGVGIDAALLPRIFTPFVQGETDGVASRRGLGLGLALSRALAELHGGRLLARSRGDGSGTELELTLPAAGSSPHPGAPATAPALVRVDKRVLVVDDNVDAADTLLAILRNAGIDTRVAHGGNAALALAREWMPDVVFLDIGMPGMDGFEVCARLRELHPDKDMVIVALTGWGQASDKRRTESAGFDLHIVKPAAIADLQAALAFRKA